MLDVLNFYIPANQNLDFSFSMMASIMIHMACRYETYGFQPDQAQEHVLTES